MALGHPELIFVAGCQEGQRSALMSNIAVVGRSQSADIQLREEYVSREQFRLTFTTDGWVVENLSDNPIRIDGKKYKRGKKVIVETGDVVAVGAETQILFVGHGDDAEEALAALRATHAVKGGVGPAEGAEAPAPDEAEGEQAAAPPAEGEVPEEPQEPPEGEAEADQVEESPEAIQRKAKLKKYGIMFGVYIGLMIGGVFVVKWLRGGGPVTTTRLVFLKRRQIERTLRAEPKRKRRNPIAAGKMLQQAKAKYRDAAVVDGNLYKSVKYFKLHLAYQQGPFVNVDDERLYDRAMDELVEKVQKKYENAVLFEKNKEWRKASLLFDELHRIVAAKGEPEPEEKNLIFDNVTRHLVYVNARANEGKEKTGSPF